MDQHRYRRLIAGPSTGPGASALRFSLRCAAIPYGMAVSFRNFLYDVGALSVFKADTPVLSVGNITAGGTGKTPLVIWLYRQLKDKHRVAILTRGYKSDWPDRSGRRKNLDEPAMLVQACPGAEVIVNADRAAAAVEAVERFGAEVIILDDGFQHRALARDLDILAVDATCPFGHGSLLPAGLLREGIGAIKRAAAAVLTRCDQVAEDRLEKIHHRLISLNRDLIVARSVHRAVGLETAQGALPLESLDGLRVFAFCGIGNPSSFTATAANIGAIIVGSQFFNDHHIYTGNELDELAKNAACCGADMLLTTEKDRARISAVEHMALPTPLATLKIELEVSQGCDRLKELIERVLADRMSRQ